jgi:hypothetical protein
MPCVCPFPQGYCPFPQGYCALPAYGCGGVVPSQQGTVAPYSYPGYYPKPYPAPTPYVPRPLGIPAGSLPSMQQMVMPNPQVASARK